MEGCKCEEYYKKISLIRDEINLKLREIIQKIEKIEHPEIKIIKPNEIIEHPQLPPEIKPPVKSSALEFFKADYTENKGEYGLIAELDNNISLDALFRAANTKYGVEFQKLLRLRKKNKK